jgi:DNA helicase-2/ATP-dependent DNA helicase PcrA
MQQPLFPGISPAEEHKDGNNHKTISRDALNKPQYEAVTHISGPLLVVAGAGSGKTRTLVYRVAHLLEQGIRPENILLLTFTRRASQEMLWRASQLLDESCQDVTGGTFHAVANLLLRRYGYHLGYAPNFTIIDRSDAEGIINILKSSLSLAGAGKRFPTKRVILNIISKAINRSTELEALLLDEYAHLDEFLSDINVLKDHYQKFKFEHSLMDYDDLLVNLKVLLQDNQQVRQEVSERFQYIMVDEYQDTNAIQAEIVRFMSCTHNNVMAVGDDSQSIYSFRGADFRNIMDFPRIFPNTKVIKLEENYRSTQPILSMTNAIIEQADEKYTKALFTRVDGGQKPELYNAADAGAEAGYIVGKIKELQKEGLALKDIAVLFRSGFHSYKLEIELASNSIPFEKRGGLKLTESAHIKDILSYFRVLVNENDYLSWNRILLLIEKIGPKTAQKILNAIRTADDPIAALSEYPGAPGWQKGLVELAVFMAALRENALTPVKQFELVEEFYRSIFERIYYDDYPKRSRDIEQLKLILEGYENLAAFVDDTALDPPETVTVEDTQDRLILSTVHSAKGLEWDTVFVISLAEGKFPVSQALPGEQLEEERRLLYVAATRAKRNLYLTYPREVMSVDRQYTRAPLTPFLSEISHALYQISGRLQSGFKTSDKPNFGFGRIPRRSRTMSAATVRKSSNQVQDANLMQVGQIVNHPFFGRGKVDKIVGERTVEVTFDRHGKKTLHLDYAKLEMVKVP